MQMPAPIRAPTFVSRRNLFEQRLAELEKCTDLNKVKQLHALIYKSNLHQDLFVAPKLIYALSICRQMALAVSVFEQVPSPNSHLCNTLIRAYIRNSEPSKAFEVFRYMKVSGILPDNYTYVFLLKACLELKSVKMIHAHVEKCNLYSDLFVPNSLIDAYARCGLAGVRAAKMVFDVMEERDVITYNSLINGLVKAGKLNEAQKLFDEMPERDTVSWNAILDGYVKAGEMSTAFQLFEEMPSRDVVSWSTIISGYAKMGDIEMARMLFDKMPVKNLVPWTIIVSLYAEKGLVKEAIGLYDQMQKAGLKPDETCLVSILAASAESGLLALGKRIHQSIAKSRYKCSTLVSNALIEMYIKCGVLNKAWSIFNAIIRKDLISWNVMIHGLAMHGYGRKALQLFTRMKSEGFTPDKVTFVGVLSACSHAGMVREGIHYFYEMESEYVITPEIEHYGCLIDLLGRAGRLNEAFKLLKEMPFEPNVVIWGSLLVACQMHNAAHRAEEVLDQLVKLEPTDLGKFSAFSNVYAAAGDQNSVAKSRLGVRQIDCRNSPGTNSMELNNKLQEVTFMNTSDLKSDIIYQTIYGLNQHHGKLTQVSNVSV